MARFLVSVRFGVPCPFGGLVSVLGSFRDLTYFGWPAPTVIAPSVPVNDTADIDDGDDPLSP